MKTEEEILNDWLSKDSMGVHWTQKDRIIFAMRDFKEQFQSASKGEVTEVYLSTLNDGDEFYFADHFSDNPNKVLHHKATGMVYCEMPSGNRNVYEGTSLVVKILPSSKSEVTDTREKVVDENFVIEMGKKLAMKFNLSTDFRNGIIDKWIEENNLRTLPTDSRVEK